MGRAFVTKENLAESFSLACRHGKLFHTHWNDNWELFDDDLIVGTVNLSDTLEPLFWLDEWGYDGWFVLDLFPYREVPAGAQSAQFLATLAQALEEPTSILSEG